MAFKSGSMEPFMRAIGSTTKLKAKEHSGTQKEISISATSRLIKLADMVFTLMSTVADTKENGSMMFSKAKEKKPGLMEPNMWVIIKME